MGRVNDKQLPSMKTSSWSREGEILIDTFVRENGLDIVDIDKYRRTIKRSFVNPGILVIVFKSSSNKTSILLTFSNQYHLNQR